MTLAETFALVSFSLFSYAAPRYWLVPSIEVFLFGTILLTLPVAPLQIIIILFACIWSIFRNLSDWFALPLFYPLVWPALLTGYGYRKGIIGRTDLLAICGLACLFPLPAVLLSLLGLELWRRFWVRRQRREISALPNLRVADDLPEKSLPATMSFSLNCLLHFLNSLSGSCLFCICLFYASFDSFLADIPFQISCTRFRFPCKIRSRSSFMGGCWVHKIFSPDLPGFFFQIRLSSTRTDAAAHSPFLYSLVTSRRINP